MATPLCNLYFSSYLLYLSRRWLYIISKLFTGPIATPECYHCLSHKSHLQLMFTLKFANIAHTLPVNSSLFRLKQSKLTLLFLSLHCWEDHSFQEHVVHQLITWEGLTDLSETQWRKGFMEDPRPSSDPLYPTGLQVVQRGLQGPSAESGCIELHPSLHAYELQPSSISPQPFAISPALFLSPDPLELFFMSHLSVA